VWHGEFRPHVRIVSDQHIFTMFLVKKFRVWLFDAITLHSTTKEWRSPEAIIKAEVAQI